MVLYACAEGELDTQSDDGREDEECNGN